VLIGTSGYVYGDWRRRFYPPALPAREWLPFFAMHFPTVELNNPFYRLPTAAMFRAWRAAVPDDFVFAVKVSRFLTHLKRLKNPSGPLRLLLTRAKPLGPTLGPLLVQLPRTFHANIERLDGLLRAVERQTIVPSPRLVLEVRHPSWLVPGVFERLAAANVGLCLHDSKTQPVTGPVTADFVYIRRHGYARRGSYTRRALEADASRIREWRAEGRDVYVYYNNDWRAFAVRNARDLSRLVGATTPARIGRSSPRRRRPAAPGTPRRTGRSLAR
jgi:uncharacterized protein YecE (DUF72 family)